MTLKRQDLKLIAVYSANEVLDKGSEINDKTSNLCRIIPPVTIDDSVDIRQVMQPPPSPVVGHKRKIFNIPKQYPIEITNDLLTPAQISVDYGNRPVTYTSEIIQATQRLYPCTITIARDLIDQSILSFRTFSARALARYTLDITEKVLEADLKKSAEIYKCVFGKNTIKPTEVTIEDLRAIRAELNGKGAASILGQHIATRQINTSGIPPAFAFISSNDALNVAIDSTGLRDLPSFKSVYQYAGIGNYSNDVFGVEATSAVAFIASNMFDGRYDGTDIYQGLLLGADSYLTSTSTPTQNQLIERSSLILSPTGMVSDYSVNCAIINAITRPEHIKKVLFTAKKTA
jgi:hypothetical protein